MTWPAHAHIGDPFGELPAARFDARAAAVAIARSHAAGRVGQETAYALAWLRHPANRRRTTTQVLALMCMILDAGGQPNRNQESQECS